MARLRLLSLLPCGICASALLTRPTWETEHLLFCTRLAPHPRSKLKFLFALFYSGSAELWVLQDFSRY